MTLPVIAPYDDLELPIAEDHEFDYFIDRVDTDSRVVEPAETLTSVLCWLSSTENGAAIDASLSVAATEAVAAPARYYGVFDQPDLTTHLTAFLGQKVYRIISKSGDFKISTPMRVVAIRKVY